MALFKRKYNPMLHESKLIDDFAYHQEVANAGFGDMLHDTERNEKYYEAIRLEVRRMKAEGREVHVLDIGTGTGLLAMMAVKAGADTVTACEAFGPMADCAERIFKANGMEDKVRLVKKRSTDMQVGEGKDLPRRANLLVAELLDTELIGEGALSIYNHAHEELLTDDVVCIPTKAICYAQIATSPLAQAWNKLKVVADDDGKVILRPPKSMESCKGEASLHDVQLSQLPTRLFRPLALPHVVFVFNFASKLPRSMRQQNDVSVPLRESGQVDMVFYWWAIQLDTAEKVTLSCAPFWARPEGEVGEHRFVLNANKIAWRDHWMQAIYYLPRPLVVDSSEFFVRLHCCHDEFSLWFDVSKQTTALRHVPRHTCSCNFHTSHSRNRIAQLNEAKRTKIYMRYITECMLRQNEFVQPNVLCLSDSCLIGLLPALLGYANVYCYEQHRFSRDFMRDMVKTNDLQRVRVIDGPMCLALSKEEWAKLTHVFGEPYFHNSILPWDNFYFGTLISQIRNKLPPTIRIAPHAARVYAMPMEFLHLHKIRMPVGECEGFDLSLFDEMVEVPLFPLYCVYH